LAEKGLQVSGIDFSRSSIDYAREMAFKKNLKVNYILENYFEFNTEERFDLITMIMCDFCALSPAQRKVILGKYRNLLKPEGKILLDIYSLNFFETKEELATYEFNFMDNFWSAEDYYCFINVIKYKDLKLLLEKHTIIEKRQTSHVYNWLQCYSPESLQKEFEENGLYIEEIYADVSGQKYSPDSLEFAVVARAS
jgi:SAM-dependent methyltransferase